MTIRLRPIHLISRILFCLSIIVGLAVIPQTVLPQRPLQISREARDHLKELQRLGTSENGNDKPELHQEIYNVVLPYLTPIVERVIGKAEVKYVSFTGSHTLDAVFHTKKTERYALREVKLFFFFGADDERYTGFNIVKDRIRKQCVDREKPRVFGRSSYEVEKFRIANTISCHNSTSWMSAKHHQYNRSLWFDTERRILALVSDYHHARDAHLNKSGQLAKALYSELTGSGAINLYRVLVGGRSDDRPIARSETDVKPAAETVGAVTHTRGLVEILPAGRGQMWKKIPRGYKLRKDDTLRTGPRGRARLDFSPDDKQILNVINIGSNSTIKVDLLHERFNNKKPVTIFSLIRGALRSFTNKLSPKREREVRPSSPTARLHIRTPNALIEKIGTDVSVSYDPDTKITDVHMDHGKVFIESGGRRVALDPRTSRSVSNGVISGSRRLTDSKWSNIVSKTGGSGDDPDNFFDSPETKDSGKNNDSFSFGDDDYQTVAGKTVSAVLDAMTWNSQSKFLENTTGIFRSTFVGEIRKLGSFEAVLDNAGTRPIAYMFTCQKRNPYGTTIELLADIKTANSPSELVLFTVENGKVSNARKAQGEVLRKFQARAEKCIENF